MIRGRNSRDDRSVLVLLCPVYLLKKVASGIGPGRPDRLAYYAIYPHSCSGYSVEPYSEKLALQVGANRWTIRWANRWAIVISATKLRTQRAKLLLSAGFTN